MITCTKELSMDMNDAWPPQNQRAPGQHDSGMIPWWNRCRRLEKMADLKACKLRAAIGENQFLYRVKLNIPKKVLRVTHT